MTAQPGGTPGDDAPVTAPVGVTAKRCYYCGAFLPSAKYIGARSRNGRRVACRGCAVGVNRGREDWAAVQKREARRR